MALVGRSPRTDLFEICVNSPGPGAYDLQSRKPDHRQSPSYTISRTKATEATPDETPGPGHYYISPMMTPEEVVLCNYDEGLLVVRKKQYQAVFKSKTPKSDPSSIEGTPGPGFYLTKDEWDLARQRHRLYRYRQDAVQKVSVLTQVFTDSQYQPTQSIPHKGIQDKRLIYWKEGVFKNCNPRILHSGKLDKKADRSKYNLQPGRTFGKSKVPRIPKDLLKDDNVPGPGSYCPINDLSITHTNKNYVQYTKSTFLTYIETKINKQYNSAEIYTDEDSSIEYVKESVPGPGSYDTNTSFSTRRNFSVGKVERFGITQKRFVEPKQIHCNLTTVTCRNSPKKPKRDPNVAFGRKHSVTPIENSRKVELGPGSYPETRTMENYLITSLKSGYQGNFGSNSQRFQKIKKCNIRDFYEIHNQIENDPDKPSHMFRSSSPRYMFLGCKDPNYMKRGYYSQDSNTIDRKIKNIKSYENNRVCFKPGFNTGMVRFQEIVKYPRLELPYETEGRIATTLLKYQYNSRGFTFSTATNKPQSVDQKHPKPGPGYYGVIDAWNSRTYNILYL